MGGERWRVCACTHTCITLSGACDMHTKHAVSASPLMDSCSSGTRSTMKALNEKFLNEKFFFLCSSTSRRAHVESCHGRVGGKGRSCT